MEVLTGSGHIDARAASGGIEPHEVSHGRGSGKSDKKTEKRENDRW